MGCGTSKEHICIGIENDVRRNFVLQRVAVVHAVDGNCAMQGDKKEKKDKEKKRKRSAE